MYIQILIFIAETIVLCIWSVTVHMKAIFPVLLKLETWKLEQIFGNISDL